MRRDFFLRESPTGLEKNNYDDKIKRVCHLNKFAVLIN